ncbi:type VII secretion target [Cellulomonas sp. S1-8]|uniref:type VII secretion target n=1 Tax=Cellulomonas sp. S1-8 TaxID=2904790 RepID=UPI002242F2D0|nr:type VII secretion target [Cellulomonas sp. S1-8]UZN03126.1 type VII secretion target [Cellulomonas sp. S1-8]
MADLVVRDDLGELAHELDRLIGEFEGALDLQDDSKGTWGQLNANLSMGDFADNWTVHRDKMVEDMKKLRDKVRAAADAWAQAEADLTASLGDDQ